MDELKINKVLILGIDVLECDLVEQWIGRCRSRYEAWRELLQKMIFLKALEICLEKIDSWKSKKNAVKTSWKHRWKSIRKNCKCD